MRTPKAGPKTGAEQKLSFIEFQLPSLSDSPPEGDGWIHEIKHDGYRTQLIVERGKARALTRRGVDWSSKYPTNVEAAAALPAESAIIDGEVVVFNEKGVSDFHALRSAMRWQPGCRSVRHSRWRRLRLRHSRPVTRSRSARMRQGSRRPRAAGGRSAARS